LAIVTAIAGLRAGTRIPFDYDVLSLLPVNSQAAQYQRRMVKETDYQSEVVIFTANTLDEIRRITDEASRLKSIAKVQSITNLFPTDADSRLNQAREIALQAAKPPLTRTLDSLATAGLSQSAYQSLIKLLEQASERIDEAQEQAFSAGHADLVKGLEKIRSNIESLLESANTDPETTRRGTEAFLRALINEAHHGIQLMRGWQAAQPLTPTDLPNTLRDRFVAPDGTLAAYAFPAKSVMTRRIWNSWSTRFIAYRPTPRVSRRPIWPSPRLWSTALAAAPCWPPPCAFSGFCLSCETFAPSFSRHCHSLSVAAGCWV